MAHFERYPRAESLATRSGHSGWFTTLGTFSMRSHPGRRSADSRRRTTSQTSAERVPLPSVMPALFPARERSWHGNE